MPERTFADLNGRALTEKSACRSCGRNGPDGVVRIEARQYGTSPDRSKRLKGGKTLASMSLSLCESCVVERYEAVEAALTA